MTKKYVYALNLFHYYFNRHLNKVCLTRSYYNSCTSMQTISVISTLFISTSVERNKNITCLPFRYVLSSFNANSASFKAKRG